jgi:hypothetical protein
MNLPGRLARLEARRPRADYWRPAVLSDAERQAGLHALIDAGLLWRDECGRWQCGDSDAITTPGYTDGEWAMMLAAMFNRLEANDVTNAAG